MNVNLRSCSSSRDDRRFANATIRLPQQANTVKHNLAPVKRVTTIRLTA
jgi:hypothetical protein